MIPACPYSSSTRKGGKNTGFRITETRFESQLCCLLAMWLREAIFLSLSFSFVKWGKCQYIFPHVAL